MLIIKNSLTLKVVIDQGYYSSGDSVECITQINSDNFMLPIPYVEVRSNAFSTNSDCLGELVTITTDENKWINNRLVFYCRGIYDLGTVSVKAYDLFNFISFTKQEDMNIKVKVYPKIYDIPKIFGGGKDIFMETLDKNISNEDPFTIKDVRKYRSGDSLKKVHWRLSAKHNELYVKNSDTVSGEEISLFLDMGKENYKLSSNGSVEEALVDISMSIINYMRKKDISINIFMNSLNLTSFKVTSTDDFNSLMELMVNIKSNGIMPIEEFIQHQCYRLHKINKIIAVTSKVHKAFANNMINLKTQGYSISVFYYLTDQESSNYNEMLKNWGITCISFENIIIN
jgi:hypothetical protein